MEEQRVLVIVGNPDDTDELNVKPEVQAILRAHGRGNVDVMYTPTRIEVAERIGNSDYAILHMAGHCSVDGFAVKDGMLSPMTIASYALSMSPTLQLVMLNACSSEDIAREIGAQSNVDVIYTVRDEEDAECIDFAILFHTKLRATSITDYAQAHALVDPSGRKFKYLVGVEMQSGDNRSSYADDLRKINERLEELTAYLVGDFTRKGLKTRVEDAESEIVLIKARVVVLEQQDKKPGNGRVSGSTEGEFYLKLVGIILLAGLAMYLATLLGNWAS